MYNMVILDDEKMERTYMKKYIDWNSLNIEIVGEAANGSDGLRVCEQLKPNIVLTDIKMPEMDGLEFSRRVKEILPDVKIIFISGYGDFDYARSAVDLNAYGYILKPFRIENVIDVIRKVISKCDDEGKKNKEREQLKKILEANRSVLKESLVRELVNGVDIKGDIWGRINFLELNVKEGKFCIIFAEVDEFEDLVRNLEQEDIQLLFLKISDNIKQSIGETCTQEIIKVSERQFIILLSFDCQYDNEVLVQKVYALSEMIKTHLMMELNISLTIGISRISEDIRNLDYLHLQAKDAVKFKIFNMKGQIISINDIQISSKEQELDLKKIDSELVEYLRLGNSEKIYALLDEIFESMLIVKKSPKSFIQNTCISMVCSAMRYLNEINCTFKDVLGDDSMVWNKLIKFETIADVKQWVKNIFRAILETVSQMKKSKNRMIVDRIIEIVNGKYNQDLTTKEISKDIFLSPNYIGAIFKDEMGIGFLEYLTRVRMEKAAEMLKDPNMKVYEIAQMVGYSNTPYFSTLFRDHTGFTPSEYRERP